MAEQDPSKYTNSQQNNNADTYTEDKEINFNNNSTTHEGHSPNNQEHNGETREQTHNFEQEALDFKNKYLRSLAELENLKKYSAKQLEESQSYAVSKFAKELLPVMDIFNKALNSANNSMNNEDSFKSFVEGIKLTQSELNKIFHKFEITTLGQELVGQPFDPNYHEALMSKPVSNAEDNMIFEVFEDGYKIKDKLLRSAKVGIVKNQ